MAFADQPSGCLGCPASGYSLGFVEPRGSGGTRWLFLGQGPGETEANTGRAFHENAPAGHRLAKWRRRAGMQDSDCTIGNLVQCWLPKTKSPSPRGNRDPTQAEIQWCWNAHVGPVVHRMVAGGGVHVVPVGAPAASWLLGVEKVGKYMGTTSMVELPPVGSNKSTTPKSVSPPEGVLKK